MPNYYYPKIFLVALVLDPKLKLDGLEEILTLYYDALILVKDDTFPNHSLIANNVRIYLNDIFRKYNLNYSVEANTNIKTQNTTTIGSSARLGKTQLFVRKRTNIRENF